MTLITLRVLCGFLAGMAAGILLMRIAFKKKGYIKTERKETPEAITSRAS